MDRAKMLMLLALRTMSSHRVKNTIVGAIMVFGTALVVLGTSLLDSIERSMQESVTSSATGHVQVFSSEAEDQLAIFGQIGGAEPDIGEIDTYSEVHAALEALPHVKAVVPMALGTTISFGKSELDRVLLDLREVVRESDREGIGRKQRHVRQIASLMLDENANSAKISTDTARLAEERAIIAKVHGETFWQGFAADPEPTLEYLDTRLAPLSTEGRMIYIRYIATEPRAFARAFDRFRIVDGGPIPEGKRGFLFSKRAYETMVKNRVAREFDKVKEDVDEGKRIADDPVLQNQIGRMARLSAYVVYQLDAEETKTVGAALRPILPGVEGDVDALVAALLTVTDANIATHYAAFYEHVVPHIDLYDIEVGDDFFVQSFTKSGYAKSAKVRVYGTFNFEGLETSDLAGATSLMDLVTFRKLYGKMTDKQREELGEIREAAGVKEITAENAEDALFGGEAELESERQRDERFEVELERDSAEAELAETYTWKDIESGLVLNIALLLDDARFVPDVMAGVRSLEEEQGLPIQAIDWQAASGLIGQFILVIRLVLFTAIFIIFLVALVIINNSMVMATMERIPEIGTMRAIGAQKSTILILTLIETVLLCSIAGVVGGAVGAGLVSVLGTVGIPAQNDVMVFLFGGPKLYPTFGLSNLVLGATIILFVSIVSTLFPALVATSVQPVVAMQGKG